MNLSRSALVLPVVLHICVPIWHLGWVMGLFTYLLYFVIYGMGSFFVSTVPHMIQDELPPHECDAIWSYQVVKNTCDYMRDSSLVRHLSGGFNIHCLHHLLPSIHGSHLPSVYPIFVSLCSKYGYPYKNITSAKELLVRQRAFLKKYSRPAHEASL